MDYFRRLGGLEIEAKGHQDFVTEADREVELLIRARLAEAWPDDAIVGEEHAPKAGSTGVTWVIDPIDGTANFVSNMPFWCVVLAGVVTRTTGGETQIAVIHDPNHGETFVAQRGQGATLNGAPIRVREEAEIGDGTISVGSSRRSPPSQLAALLQSIVEAGGVFQRLGSGALGLAYTANGRYLGYSESYMNAWDCLAGQLLIEEAGGTVERQDADQMITQGGRVIAAPVSIFPTLERLTTAAFGPEAPPKPTA
jgi:myo-inositol-1(or 4)-monophosphatase